MHVIGTFLNIVSGHAQPDSKRKNTLPSQAVCPTTLTIERFMAIDLSVLLSDVVAYNIHEQSVGN